MSKLGAVLPTSSRPTKGLLAGWAEGRKREQANWRMEGTAVKKYQQLQQEHSQRGVAGGARKTVSSGQVPQWEVVRGDSGCSVVAWFVPAATSRRVLDSIGPPTAHSPQCTPTL